MFIHTNSLNEGAGPEKPEKQEKGRTRELREGKNLREADSVWQSAGSNAHSNYRWQKLRK